MSAFWSRRWAEYDSYSNVSKTLYNNSLKIYDNISGKQRISSPGCICINWYENVKSSSMMIYSIAILFTVDPIDSKSLFTVSLVFFLLKVFLQGILEVQDMP